ncbi:MAG: DUF1844 domain-containing protein [Pseudomonadota bacterium]
MSKDDKEKKEKIKVVDKRKVGREESDAEDDAPEPEAPAEKADAAPPQEAGDGCACDGFPEKMDFITFIMSMSQTALLSMGCGPNPETGETCCDLRSSKYSIDILEVIQEKTKGNLTGEEERLLDRILTELRLMWVHKSKQANKS